MAPGLPIDRRLVEDAAAVEERADGVPSRVERGRAACGVRHAARLWGCAGGERAENGQGKDPQAVQVPDRAASRQAGRRPSPQP
jgi:hypothetical protein